MPSSRIGFYISQGSHVPAFELGPIMVDERRAWLFARRREGQCENCTAAEAVIVVQHLLPTSPSYHSQAISMLHATR